MRALKVPRALGRAARGSVKNTHLQARFLVRYPENAYTLCLG